MPTLEHAPAALEAVHRAGFAVERAEVSAVAANVLARLEPGPIAARSASGSRGFEIVVRAACSGAARPGR